MKRLFKVYSIEIFLGTIFVMLGVFGLVRSCENNPSLSQTSGLTDTIKVWREEGKEHAKTQAIVSDNTVAFLKETYKDQQIKELQELVKKYKKQLSNKGSVTNIKTETKLVEKLKTDTVYVDSTGNKTLMSHFKDDWVDLNIKSRVDTTQFELSVKNDYSVIIGEDKTGFLGLGKPKTYAEVINHNPYTETKNIKVFVKEQPKRKPVWAYTLVGGILIGIIITK